MADNENTITVVGRIGQEPELRATTKGDVCNFSVATSERRRGADGTWADGATSWFRVAAWNDLGRHAHASLHKGQQIIVRGVLTIVDVQLEGGGRIKNAEVRATAVGHDLRWGTTTYTDQRSTDRRPVEAALAAAAPAPTPAAGAQTEEPEVQREPVPVGGGGDWGAKYDEETPF